MNRLTRIRYIENNNILTSKEEFSLRGVKFGLQLNLNDLTYVVTKDGNQVATGQKTTVNELKKAAKKSLESFGIQFRSETRAKREKVIVNDGSTNEN